MRKQILFLIGCIVLSSNLFAQQVGTGYTTIQNYPNRPLTTEFYLSNTVLGYYPYQSAGTSVHLINSRTTEDRNYQFQIASSFNENDRVFFRKIAIHTWLTEVLHRTKLRQEE